MDSVYDAAKKHADELKTELAKLQTYLDLHDHFSERFGLTASMEVSQAASAQAADAGADHAAATHEIHVQQPVAADEDAVQASAPEAPATALDAPELDAPKFDAPEHGAEADHEAAPSDETRVIKASEGVLIATTYEAEEGAPLGPEATLQSVAEKLAATINAAHPSVTGYTV